MEHPVTRPSRPRTSRLALALAALITLAGGIALSRHTGVGWWVFPVFLVGPDLAFLVGLGETSGLGRGQMPRRAVRPYNALHRVWGPAVLGAAALTFLAPVFLVGAILWGFHILFDRALGYGLRTPDGWRA